VAGLNSAGVYHKSLAADDFHPLIPRMDYGKLYDKHVAATYDQDALGLLAGPRALAIAQIEQSTLARDATILDLGVGTGQTLLALQARFPQARRIGIDLSARMLEVAAQRIAVEAHVDDACNAGAHVPPGSVDLVLAHFLTTFVDRPKLFRAAARTLRPGGLFSVVSTPSEAFRRVRAGVDQLFGQAGLADRVSPSPETAEVLAAELADAGFEIRASETFRRPIVFDSFQPALEWGLQSGFFAHAIEAIGMERVQSLAPLTRGMFPFHDEYVGVAILAAPRAR
jgi:SAM-dependent methyltransferase